MPVEAVKDEGEAIVVQEKKKKEPVAKETEEEYEDFEVANTIQRDYWGVAWLAAWSVG